MRSADICSTRAAIARGQTSASRLIEHSLTAARQSQHVFTQLFEPQARTTAAAVDAGHAAGAPLPPLAGLSVSIKALFDVAGQRSCAGSASRQDAPPAARDAPAVARLRAAGAALIGHTNLSEFAFSGVGINPHYGTPANPATQTLDAEARIPGGSTSGGAVSVSLGAAFAALGSDTGGSIRIPAALQGLVGFKNTARLTPRDGSIPLSTSLDTVCALTRSVRDARLMHEILSAAPCPTARPESVQGLRLAVLDGLMQDQLDAPVARAFERSLARLSHAGAHITQLPARLLDELPALQHQGGFAAAESWAWHRTRLIEREAQYDPRVALRIRRGAAISAADYIELLQARERFIAQLGSALAQVDAVLSPTVPLIAPPIAPLLASDEAFFSTNALLLRNTAIVNLLDGCALSLPCQDEGEWPVGLMLWQRGLQDARLLDLAQCVEACLAGHEREENTR